VPVNDYGIRRRVCNDPVKRAYLIAAQYRIRRLTGQNTVCLSNVAKECTGRFTVRVGTYCDVYILTPRHHGRQSRDDSCRLRRIIGGETDGERVSVTVPFHTLYHLGNGSLTPYVHDTGRVRVSGINTLCGNGESVADAGCAHGETSKAWGNRLFPIALLYGIPHPHASPNTMRFL
jgi:hypothetical protein